MSTVLLIDPDWNHLEEEKVTSTLKKYKDVDIVIYSDPIHFDRIKNNSIGDVVGHDIIGFTLSNYSLEKLDDLAWEIASNFDYQSAKTSLPNLILYCDEYNIIAKSCYMVRKLLLLELLSTLSFKHIIVLAHEHFFLELENCVTATVKWDIDLPSILTESSKSRISPLKELKRYSSLVKANLLGIWSKWNSKIGILYQDHRNTIPYINYLENDKEFCFFRLGSTRSREFKGISIEYTLYALYKKWVLGKTVHNLWELEHDINIKFQQISYKSISEKKLFFECNTKTITSNVRLLDHKNLKRNIEKIQLYKKFFTRYRPNLILLNNYQSFDQKLLIYLSKQFDIPSSSVEHGLFNRVRFRNDIIHTDYYYVWGRYTKSRYKSNNKGKIRITGNPLSTIRPPKHSKANDRPKILLSSPVAPFFYRHGLDHIWSPLQTKSIFYEEFRFFSQILDYLINHEYKVHLQIHPGHDFGKWQKFLQNKNVSYSQRDVYERLPEYDILILSNSTLVIEGLMQGLDIILYAGINQEIQNEIYIDFESDSVSICRNLNEISLCLNNIATNKPQRSGKEQKSRLIKNLVGYCGDKALYNMKKNLMKILG